ncbi:protein SABRE isoform X2 [Sorghum bicolor]|uniref:protein SABRE isoform X2 n=1 Tax=Sorghum bicolor TaxID=4558 RepID=UPI000B42423D|nr:protein SABRE isoform X2 [Sorghum bicolor]|eukprot:XP_021318208.1 protein SABRE isoform X2 [Sorghum bicolor]
MASSPVKFFSVFLAVSVVGWVVFTFASRLLAWFLSRVFSASVGFRVAGFNCLRDVTIKFCKGSVESVSIGEIKLSFRKSLVKLSFGVISKDPKLQLLINDLEIVIRSSSQNKKIRKSARPRSTGKGKWLVTSSMARLLSVSVTDLIIKVPKGAVDIKELTVDTFKIAGPNHILGVKLHLLPLNIHFGDLGLTTDPMGSCSLLDAFQSDQASVSNSEKSLAPFACEDLLVTCNFGHENFSVPKLDVKFRHLQEGLSVDNNITGIQFTCAKSLPQDDFEEATPHFDVQIDLSEIHLIREGSSSLLEVLKVFAIASLDVPVDPFLPIRAEIDAKLGGTQCNVMLSRLMPWMRLHSLRTKGMKLSKTNSNQEVSQKREIKPILWTCTVAAPEMTVLLYSLNGLVLYHACSQSSHFFANNIASKGIQIHTELGELLVHMEEEYRKFLKENIFGVDTYSGSLMHITKMSLDWGYRESDVQDMVETSRHALVFSIDISDIEVKFGFRHLESLVLNLMSFRTLFKSLQSSGGSAKEKNLERRGEKKMKGVKKLKLSLQKLSITYCGDANIVNMPIADPKRVNYGSQGGQVIVSVSADGTPRRASITSVLPGCHLRFSASLVLSHLSMCIDKERKTTEAKLERVKAIYEELPEDRSGVRVTLLDMQNAKIVRRSSGHTEVAVCSLFSASDIYLRWEPDAHLALYETFIRFKHFLHHESQKSEKKTNTEVASIKANEHGNMTAGSVKPQKSDIKGSVFAIDVDVLRVSAELADGVEANMHVQSIFTENAKIGVLSEGLSLTLNGARVLKSTRIQISCIPFSTGSLLDAKVEPSSKRDWVVQGLDVHICMPYRLPLRAIEDAVEDMIRALKLISSAKRSIICPDGKEKSRKVNSGGSKFGSVKFVLRKLTADIEEEPIQGWLDEHYHLMRSKICELGVRLNYLEEAISASVDPSNRSSERKVLYNGVEVDIHDTAALQRLQEEIHKQAFRSYYVACQNMVHAEGSGACSEGFQAGFRQSSRRASLLSFSASDLDVTLTRIDGGEVEMVEFIKGLDSVCQEQNIPFSRLYGSDVSVVAGSLVVQLRDYTSPLFSSLSGKCQGRIVFAQQATCFQPQIHQELYIGRWQKVKMLRSASGTTPAMKMYSNLPIYFQKGEISFGVGYEPSFADISYAFQVALRKVNLSNRASCSGPAVQLPKKERSLPWWDDMRYYLHGKIILYFNETKWKFLATTNPYEHVDKLQIVSEYMEIQQTDGRVDVSAKEFKIYISSVESITKNRRLKVPSRVPRPFIYAPLFSLNVVIDWQCESRNPLNHYLHALPVEGEPRKKVYDPFRSTYLSLRWNFSLRPLQSQYGNGPSPPFYGNNSMLCGTMSGSPCKMADEDFPTMNLGAHDLAWVFKWWSLNYSPPHKLRSFSRWRRFGIPRATRSGNLSLDKVLVEFFFRVDATPCCIRHAPLSEDDDPASGLTFKMSNLKYELCYSRGKQQYTFDCKRESLDLVYRGLDLHMPEVYLMRDSNLSKVENVSKVRTMVQQSQGKFVHDRCNMGNFQEKHEDGFLLSSDYITIRRQTRKADPERLMGWQDTGRSHEITYVRSEFEDDSESDHPLSEPSDDDDDFNVVLADNCQRVFVYGLRILWTIQNRDAVWSWVGGISKAFESPKPSPSRQYAQRKMIEERNAEDSKLAQDSSSSIHVGSPSVQHLDASGSSSSLHSKANHSSDVAVKHDIFDDSDKGGTAQYMVNVITPQFNLHSEEANGRFLLAAASGRVLARSFHSVVHLGKEILEQALGTSSAHILELQPEMTWNKSEVSVMLKDVQAHVAPTDVDPGAGLQWLPKVLGSSEKLKRTGALLERVFMPCQMYFRYTRHKGGTADLRVKPLKELRFNSPDITATMTSRQFQVLFDVLRNLVLARTPKPRKNSLQYPSDDEDIEEEADEVVPDGVEEVELAKITLEQREREIKLLLDDIRSLTGNGDIGTDHCHSAEKGDCLWMINNGKASLVEGLKRDFANLQKSRISASSALRKALSNASQSHLEKEKNKTTSCAMRISMKISKVVWSMLADGNTFAEAEINDMVYDFDRDYKDIGIAQFTTKYFVVRNCMVNAKCDTLLSAWNTPPGKINMLRVDAKQGAPKNGSYPLELFQVEIYPLRIYLSEAMYKMMWEYFFPEEDDSQRRQEVWRVSTSTGPRRTRRLSSGVDAVTSSSYSVRDHELPGKSTTTVSTSTNVSSWQGLLSDNSQVSKFQSIKANMVCGSHQELHRSSSFERNWEESVSESVASNDVVSVINSTVSSKVDASNSVLENPVAGSEMWRSKMKDSKPAKSGRLSHEEKKLGKSIDEKKTKPRKSMEFHNIKISQVELLVTYEGSRLAINDLRLLMDTFHKAEFTGTWRRLFSRVKKHIIWGVLKSVTGMQGKKFSNHRETLEGSIPENDLNLSDSDVGHHGRHDQLTASWLKRPGEGAGDGFVTSIRGLFNTQRRKAKAFVIRTMRGEGHNNDEYQDEWSESDGEYPFARQLTITKAKKLIRRKFRPRGQKNSGLSLQDSLPSSPRETTPYQSDSSRSSYEDFHEQ